MRGVVPAGGHMNESISGIHHVTAISGDAQQNLDFYGGVMGLRLVKRTVNYDDPNTYHLYCGDDLGRPGTILTFFPWRDVPRGIPGAGEVAVTSFAIPPRAVDYWIERLESQRIGREAPTTRFGDTVISFSDPHGLRLDLVGTSGVESLPAWDLGPVPRGF